MKPIRTFREQRIIVHAREAMALCDASLAKRTDPTPEQIDSAQQWWHGPSVLERLAHLFRKSA